MIVEETFYRPAELTREPRTLPADTYNLARRFLARASDGCVFVPIRSMQYLAVLDREEIIFVFREGRRLIEIAWQGFRPQDRNTLDAPVAYDAVYYAESAGETMRWLQSEFLKALRDFDGRAAPRAGARIIPLARRNP
ncbi:MAG: hypothetical protein L0Y45_09845 [Woeseiaceae bacterium]|nr:hypothetical protein [Woeseiaceae bacterium]